MTGIAAPPPPIRACDLALEVILSSDAPLLMLDGNLLIVAASKSFCRAFHINPSTTIGKPMADLGAGEWNVPQLDSLLRATASGYAEVEGYEMTLKRLDRPPAHLVINAHKIEYPDGANIRLLLSVLDVTAARHNEKAKDDLVREKAVLLQELQHRVANSLQIIASVLMQSARKIQSEETRGHLYDAHSRVMSVAALQKQLATSQVAEVRLRSYFDDLCRSIGASMIHDRNLVSLAVTVDDSIVKAEISISLGLIVTELVINSLKHAFPEGRGGRIAVDYRSSGGDWVLSVGDDGIGMPTVEDGAKPGLGTNIVKALATQVDAVIEIADAGPGTLVSLRHSAAAPASADETAPV